MAAKKILCPCCNKLLCRQTVSKHRRGLGSQLAQLNNLHKRGPGLPSTSSSSDGSAAGTPPRKRRRDQPQDPEAGPSHPPTPPEHPSPQISPLDVAMDVDPSEVADDAPVLDRSSSPPELSDDEDVVMDIDSLSETDLRFIRGFAMRHLLRLSQRQYAGINDFSDAPFPSVKQTRTRMKHLSAVSPVYYDCCIESCCCYTGDYAILKACPFCKKPRFDARTGRPLKRFAYMPFTPRLKAMYANRSTSERMQYRARQEDCDGASFSDFTDGEHYRFLRKERVVIDGREQTFYYFSDGRDVALALSTDGFCPFKTRRVSCWPLLLINLNLSPEERYKQENVISLGVIPGPKQPEDIDSYLWPFLQEILALARGQEAFDAREGHSFVLRAYLIIVLGDVPAISKLMRMKGVNGRCPCRFCSVGAIPIPNAGPGQHTCYIPHNRSGFPGEQSVDLAALPVRTHDEILRTAAKVDSARPTAADELAKATGIKGSALLSRVPGVNFPRSFPCEFMHLGLLNVIPLLVSLYTTEFKGLDEGSGTYRLAPTVWDAIGAATKKAGDTIPSAFGRRVPNLADATGFRTAEMWSVWGLYIAPALLKGRFRNEKYYEHFVDLIVLFTSCINLKITRDEVAGIRAGFIDWVERYEKYFYQYDPTRIPVCTLMIHMLLHIADSIEAQGPLWVYWSFVMERHCGLLGRVLRSRQQPWANLDQFLLAEAQLRAVQCTYNVDDAALRHSTHRPSQSPAKHIEGYPTCELLGRHQVSPVNQHLREQLANTLAAWFTSSKGQDRIRPLLPPTIEEWGKVRRLDGGDTMHAADVVTNENRDMTFVKYEQMVDLLSRQRGTAVYGLKTFCGQLRRILVLPILPRLARILGSEAPPVIVFAVIQECDSLSERDKAGLRWYQKLKTGTELTNLKTIECVVGRVQRGQNQWAIVDRSNALSRVVFTGSVDDNDEPVEE